MKAGFENSAIKATLSTKDHKETLIVAVVAVVVVIALVVIKMMA